MILAVKFAPAVMVPAVMTVHQRSDMSLAVMFVPAVMTTPAMTVQNATKVIVQRQRRVEILRIRTLAVKTLLLAVKTSRLTFNLLVVHR